MEQDLFQLVPSEITLNILSRLDVRATATSKCVCKSWLDLLSTDYFVQSHLLSKSVPALAVCVLGEDRKSSWCKVLQFDEDDDRRCSPVTKFDFPHGEHVRGVADGLLLLLGDFGALSICNPITREYVKLCNSAVVSKYQLHHQRFYGFGVSKITRQHKVVKIIHKPNRDSWCKFDVNVYTLETGSWRCFEAAPAELLDDDSFSVCVNGKLHWVGIGDITCFDLETECFSTLSAVPHLKGCYKEGICVYKDYLCVCYDMLDSQEVWLMKEYGVVNSWTKEYVISSPRDFPNIQSPFSIIKVFKNGDIWISGVLYSFGGYRGEALLRYSSKKQTTRRIGGVLQLPRGSLLLSLLPITPSFLSLKRNFGMKIICNSL